MFFIQIMTREQFLKYRERQMSEAKLMAEVQKIVDKEATHIIMDAGDDIICDMCNADVLNPIVHMVDGRSIFCDVCLATDLKQKGI